MYRSLGLLLIGQEDQCEGAAQALEGADRSVAECADWDRRYKRQRGAQHRRNSGRDGADVYTSQRF